MQKELLQLSRDKFDVFYDINNSFKYGDKYLPLPNFQIDLCNKLLKFTEDLKAGKSPRLIINIPRGHSKSWMFALNYPLWLLGNNPDYNIGLATYGQELSDDWGREARDILLSDWYQSVFNGIKVRSDNKSVAKWQIEQGGGYRATSVGGSLRGKRLNLLIIDDPHKSVEELTETEANRAFSWYEGTAEGTLKKEGGVIIIMQRLSQLDLVQKLLDEQERLEGLGMPHHKWDILIYPAEYEDGSPLWGELFPKERLDKLKGNPQVWFSQYMQEPVAGEAMTFKKEDIKFYSDELQYTRTFTMLDPAISTQKSADHTAIITIGVKDLNVYVIETTAGHFKPEETLKHLFRHQKSYNSDVGVEVVSAQKLWTKLIYDYMLETKQKFALTEVRTTTNKETKITTAISSVLGNGRLYIKSNQTGLYAQIITFPKSRRDDEIDCLAMAIEQIDFKPKAEIRINKPKTPIRSPFRRFNYN